MIARYVETPDGCGVMTQWRVVSPGCGYVVVRLDDGPRTLYAMDRIHLLDDDDVPPERRQELTLWSLGFDLDKTTADKGA